MNYKKQYVFHTPAVILVKLTGADNAFPGRISGTDFLNRFPGPISGTDFRDRFPGCDVYELVGTVRCPLCR